MTGQNVCLASLRLLRAGWWRWFCSRTAADEQRYGADTDVQDEPGRKRRGCYLDAAEQKELHIFIP